MSASCSGCKEDLLAMKAVPKNAISEYAGSRTIVEKEVFRHAVGHPFLVQLHSYFEIKRTHYFMMDYMSGATMWEKLNREGFLSELARFYGAELILAVEHLHAKGIVHRHLSDSGGASLAFAPMQIGMETWVESGE
jgi:serine/threonine protein kinase